MKIVQDDPHQIIQDDDSKNMDEEVQNQIQWCRFVEND